MATLAALIPLLAFLSNQDLPAPGDYTRTVRSDGLERTYRVHIPEGYDLTPTPVVLAYHGGASNAEGLVRYTGLDEKADEAGFIAVYPNGTGRLGLLTFNAGSCCGYAMNNAIDDVTFTRLLLEDLADFVSVDTRRVFATGMSNGAMMAYRLASELSDRIAAIAPVAGPMSTDRIESARPVPILHFHGTDDRFAPFGGGHGSGLSGTDFTSVDVSVGRWIEANGCGTTTSTARLPDRADDLTRVTRQVWNDCQAGAEVILYRIEGGGHTWPGGAARLVNILLGTVSRDISANDVMWEFFERHPMDEMEERVEPDGN